MHINKNVLKFGQFTLKSGRTSPYFFNAGLLYQGKALAALGRSYADAIVANKLEFDVIFGPAYKGISLAALTAAALYEHHGVDVPFAYNRKEKKTHGEGGQVVGCQLAGKKVLVIDDVITAGTAIREVKDILESESAQMSAVMIGLNRQERGKGELSAIQEVERDYNIPVASIIALADIINYVQEQGNTAVLTKIEAYREQYGVA